ncbi:MAG: hypothetical protein LBU23_07950, partial [Planctomycetota bacterium]|nr:hypothetical protein [Planctomycetota bacterium]
PGHAGAFGALFPGAAIFLAGGGAFEHELDGLATASSYGHAIAVPKLRSGATPHFVSHKK